MDYILTARSLGKRYKNFKALNDFSIHVPKGAIYGFVGKNGAGKTTFIRLVCGLQEPSAGSYAIYGTENTDPGISRCRRRMGAVVETPSIYQDMTAEENLKEQYRIIGLPSFDSIPELLRLVGLENTGKKKAKHFSLGMKQRLGIAIALSGNPDFLILDEPVNGLDPQGIIEVRELILKLNCEKGITFLISSHILDELSRVLDEMDLEYSILSDTIADIFARINVSQLALALADQGCDIISLDEREESLESYYVNLIGGGNQNE